MTNADASSSSKPIPTAVDVDEINDEVNAEEENRKKAENRKKLVDEFIADEVAVNEAKSVAATCAIELLKLWLAKAWKPPKPTKKSSLKVKKKGRKRSKNATPLVIHSSTVSPRSSSTDEDEVKNSEILNKYGISVIEDHAHKMVILQAADKFRLSFESSKFISLLFHLAAGNDLYNTLCSHAASLPKDAPVKPTPKTISVSLNTKLSDVKCAGLVNLANHFSQASESIVKNMDCIRVVDDRIKTLRLKKRESLDAITESKKFIDGVRFRISTDISQLFLCPEGVVLPSLVAYEVFKVFKGEIEPELFLCHQNNPEKDDIRDAVHRDGKAFNYYE